jgi:hypothetical protein
MTPELLADVVGVTASVIQDPSTGKPLVVPRASAGRAAPRDFASVGARGSET